MFTSTVIAFFIFFHFSHYYLYLLLEFICISLTIYALKNILLWTYKQSRCLSAHGIAGDEI
jgi:hypothetical protein